MDYITTNKNDEYLWDWITIIDSKDNDLINLKNTIYLIKNNMVHIFYVKIYNYSHQNRLQSRNEMLFSYYLKSSEELKYNKYGSSKIEKCCEFCFKISKNVTLIIDDRFNDTIICKPCLLAKKPKSYHINDRLFKSTNSINIEMIKKIGNNLVYFYSTQQYYDGFGYFRLLNPRYYQIANTKLCQFCHKNEKIDPKESMDCHECRQFSLNQYHVIYIKAKYLSLINDLHPDVVSVIIKFYIMLHDFDKREFVCYYNKVNKKDEVVNNLPKNDIKEIIIKEEDDLIYDYESNDEYIDPDLINCDDNDDECDLTNFDDY